MEYAFRLRACNSVGASTWSAVEHTKTAPAPPSAPLELNAVGGYTATSHRVLFACDACKAELKHVRPGMPLGPLHFPSLLA